MTCLLKPNLFFPNCACVSIHHKSSSGQRNLQFFLFIITPKHPILPCFDDSKHVLYCERWKIEKYIKNLKIDISKTVEMTKDLLTWSCIVNCSWKQQNLRPLLQFCKIQSTRSWDRKFDYVSFPGRKTYCLKIWHLR